MKGRKFAAVEGRCTCAPAPVNLNWRIELVTEKKDEKSWVELAEALKLFFDNVVFTTPQKIKTSGFFSDFIFTDDKEIFILAKQEYSKRCLYLPIPASRRDVAELFRTMAFSFISPEALKD